MPSGKLCKPYKPGSPASVTLAMSFINLKLGSGCLRSKKNVDMVHKSSLSWIRAWVAKLTFTNSMEWLWGSRQQRYIQGDAPHKENDGCVLPVWCVINTDDPIMGMGDSEGYMRSSANKLSMLAWLSLSNKSSCRIRTVTIKSRIHY
jgi:hypothetical protein